MDESDDDKGAEKDEAPESSIKLQRGRYLLPPGFEMGQGAGADQGECDAEAKEFDELMNSALKESLAEAQSAAGGRKVISGSIGKKIGANLALPLNLWMTKMAAHEEARSIKVYFQGSGRRVDCRGMHGRDRGQTAYNVLSTLASGTSHVKVQILLCTPPPLSKQRLSPSNTRPWFRQFLHC